MLLQKLAYLSVLNNEPNKAIYFIFQGTTSIQALTDVLLNELRGRGKHGWLNVQMDRCHDLYRKLTGTKATINYQDIEFSFALPQFDKKWDVAFRACIEDLADRQAEKGETLTLIFDELPIMLWAWITAGKADDAMAFLDLLRNIHYSLKDSSRIRFVFCGSVGMNVVLAKLKRDHQYTGEPLNYTKEYRLPPMSNSDALLLCACLYLSSFQCDDDSQQGVYFQLIVDNCNRLPYFINAVFSVIQTEHDSVLSIDSINQAIQSIVTDSGSVFDVFKQLDTRLTTYYPTELADVMYACLKVLAKVQSPLAEEEMKRQLPFEERLTQTALDTLWQDELLQRTFDAEENRLFSFKYDLIKRWWKRNRA
ncbi:hypothetical protein [Fibrella aquatica]|uniref:hypothetical protein n=1 Tax=Fibrella aquatica TaxID=3242487 RepID=UPI0035225C0F